MPALAGTKICPLIVPIEQRLLPASPYNFSQFAFHLPGRCPILGAK
jgi:hypothetical protein